MMLARHRATLESDTLAMVHSAHEAAQRLEANYSEELADEQLRMAVEHASMATLIATAFALLLAWQLPTNVGTSLVIGWVVLKLAIGVPRIVQTLVYRHQGFPGGERWRTWIYRLLALDGFVWGLAGLGVAADTPNVVSILIPCLTCVAIVATYGHQGRFAATAAYVVPIILLTAIGLLLRMDKLGTLWGIGLLALLGLLLSTARRGEARLAENLLLRLKAVRSEKAKDEALALAKHYAAAHELRADALEVANRTDPLTGAANRLGFMRALRHLLDEGEDFRAKGAVFYIDLDGFKAVNDTAGHDAGDVVLANVARVLGEIVRSNDVVARVGGDEFAIVAYGLSTVHDARALAAKMMVAVADIRVPGHVHLAIGATMGACLLPDPRLHDAESAVRQADALMFEAKRAAKGSFRIFGECEGEPSAGGAAPPLGETPRRH